VTVVVTGAASGIGAAVTATLRAATAAGAAIIATAWAAAVMAWAEAT